MQRKLDNKPSSVARRSVVWHAAAAVWRRTELFGPEQWRYRAESDALHWVYSHSIELCRWKQRFTAIELVAASYCCRRRGASVAPYAPRRQAIVAAAS